MELGLTSNSNIPGAVARNDNSALEVKYGLPRDVNFCKTCVLSNQRPNSTVEYFHTTESKKSTIFFDEEGVCDACRFTEKKNKSINWNDRDKELRELCDRYRKNDGSYDCLIPGSGGKDSFYAAHVLKTEYGMHPLTVTWAPHIYTPWGYKNFQAWIHAGFDNYLCSPNGLVHRLLTRLAVERLFHPFQPFILGQKNLAPNFATRFDIPLIFYGENEAEYGNPIADTETAKRDWSYFTASDTTKIFLAGTSMEELTQDFGVDSSELQTYLPSDPEILEKKGVEVHYLGYYLKWHPQSCYYYSVEHGGFEPSPERTPGTFSKYNSIDDKIDDFHYYTTYIKFGLGRASYDAAQEIFAGDITRDEGVSLVHRFDGEYPTRFEDEIFKYLSITEDKFPIAAKQFKQQVMDREYFMDLAENFRSPHLWKFENGQYKLRYQVT